MEPIGESNVRQVSETLNALEKPPLTPPPVAEAEPQPLIGDIMRAPGWLWLTHVIPAVLLFVSFFHAYYLISGETNAEQRWVASGLAVGLAVLTAAVGVLAIRLQVRRQRISNPMAVALFAAAGLMTGLGICFLSNVLPASIPDWIVSSGELTACCFVLGMPGAFYALMLLSSFPRGRMAHEVGYCLAGLIASPFVLGWLIGILSALNSSSSHLLGSFITISVLLSGAAVVSFATIRAALVIYTSVRRYGPGVQWTMMFLVALVGPIAGLVLNAGIPFPSNFQAPLVYTLTLINAGLLMLPVFRSLFWHRVIWLAQCAMLPFSAYFFLVFLPWLPLAPFAMIIMGAGVLMLVPIVLGLIHGYRVVDGYREEIRDGRAWKPAVMGLIALSVLPVGYGVRMMQDRHALQQALTYYYSPDYRRDVTFPGNLDRLEETLQHLRDMKHGIWLPFLSSLYNSVVFDNLVLPDSKIDTLQLAFFGVPADGSKGSLLEPMGRSSRRGDWQPTRIPPPHDAVLQDLKEESTAQDAVATTKLTLTMENPTDRQTEFVTSITIPEGVYISDFGLYIGDQLVPGKIVEKKTALWVYEKISVVERRDPGILTYKSPTELELRVFPLAAKEKRRVVIELTYPAAMSVVGKVGERPFYLGRAVLSSLGPVAACWTPAQSVVMPNGNGTNYFLRQPYLHVLIDCSRGASYSEGQLRQAVAEAARTVPEAREIKVTSVNFELRDFKHHLVPIEKLDYAALQKSLLPMRGGFLQDRALKRGLLLADDRAQISESTALQRPQFVIVTRDNEMYSYQSKLREANLDAFLRRVPDARVIYLQKVGSSPQPQDLVTRDAVTNPAAKAVTLWKWGGKFAVSDGSPAIFPEGVAAGTTPFVYRPKLKVFESEPMAVSLLAENSRYADGVRTWAAQEQAYFQPAADGHQSAATLRLGKKTRILTTDAAYIVVERSSQWKAMEEKEKQKLASNQAFEIEEPENTPEPTTITLLLVGAVVMLLVRRYRYRMA